MPSMDYHPEEEIKRGWGTDVPGRSVLGLGRTKPALLIPFFAAVVEL